LDKEKTVLDGLVDGGSDYRSVYNNGFKGAKSNY
jgi:hypothetical protein